uniref:Uncharacterized protein n=1 Tax=Cyanothece sp. (strain PCC 7425 / ATCC 29141) TaxID=395961 RepID=B8HUC8_CYAP4
MLDVEKIWRELVRPWFKDNESTFAHLDGYWGAEYCLDKFLQAIRESPATLPIVYGLVSQCKTKITYYFLGVDDPEYQRWLPICRVDYESIIPNHSAPILILRKSDEKLGYLDRETLVFNADEDISRFIWAVGTPEYTPIRVIDKSQTYVPSLIRKAKKICADNLWGEVVDDYCFAKDILISAASLLPRWGSKKMFLYHLPICAVMPKWTTIDEAEKSEMEIQQDLVKWLESSGHSVEIHPRISNSDIPDLLVDSKVLVEVKKNLGRQKARNAIGQVQGYPGEYTKVIAGPLAGADLNIIKNAGISVYLQTETGQWLFIKNN